MAKKIVELRKRESGNFTGEAKIHYVKTHIQAVDGLLDNNQQLNLSLIPKNILNISKNAGSINGDMSLNTAFGIIEGFAGVGNEDLYQGSFLISNGENNISASAYDVIQYNDEDGISYGASAILQHGDHLYLVSHNQPAINLWKETPTVPSTDLMYTFNPAKVSPTANSDKRLIQLEFDLEYYGTSATGLSGMEVAADTFILPQEDSRDINDWSAEMVDSLIKAAIIDTPDLHADGTFRNGYGYASIEQAGSPSVSLYYKLTYKRPGPTYFTSQLTTNVWGIINNKINLASSTTDGLMSSEQFSKLSLLPNNADLSILLSSKQNKLTATNHVTIIGNVVDLKASTTSVKGALQLADLATARLGTNTTKGIAPDNMKKLTQKFSLETFTLGNVEDYKPYEGAFALIESGTIT